VYTAPNVCSRKPQSIACPSFTNASFGFAERGPALAYAVMAPFI
jgi:hypothetical protein